VTPPVFEGPVRQIGYVVRDLDAAVQSWLAIDVGPWYTIRRMPQPGCTYRGDLCEPTISIALANTGPMQIELIEVHDDGPSIYREFLDAGREGYHQLAYWVTDFDDVLRRAEAAGWPVVFSGGDSVRFAYLEVDALISTIIEVTELNDLTRGLDALLTTAAADWDGSDPVRPLPMG
jgi:catechol 2,3-dioxygenase-like lactoylglutathione lyase family enzyme